MHEVYLKKQGSSVFIRNHSDTPEIVLIYPIIQNDRQSMANWKKLLVFFNDSSIKSLVVVDKTETKIAIDYFNQNFTHTNKYLYLLPRSPDYTLFDTVGEIVLDENMWIIQIHDGDDEWTGDINPSILVDKNTVYFSDYFKYSLENSPVMQKDFSMPNRIVFSLVPTNLWNIFARFIQDQKHHVAGSSDFTLNFMAKVFAKFQYFPGYRYYWNEKNWISRRIATIHLKKLTQADGWKSFSSPEVAIIARTIDCLASLNYLKDIGDSRSMQNRSEELLTSFKLSRIRIHMYNLKILRLTIVLWSRSCFYKSMECNKMKLLDTQRQIDLFKFLKLSSKSSSIQHVLNLIHKLQQRNEFEKLETRFIAWKRNLTELSNSFSEN
jgi:hypothetical protein